MTDRKMWRLFNRLQTDAVERGFLGAAEAYGWSAIRMGAELLRAEKGRLRKATADVLRRKGG